MSDPALQVGFQPAEDGTPPVFTTLTSNGALFLFQLVGVAADGDIITLTPAERDGTADNVRIWLRCQSMLVMHDSSA